MRHIRCFGARKMAAALERSFIEICGFERETVSRFRDLTINLGVSTFPGGGRLADSAGAFSYEESGKLLSLTSNRFIHWSTSGDTVQLVEQSLDANLLNNSLRLKILNCSVLPGGVHIHETLNNVIVLIVTNQSVHRMVLPHPTRMYRSELVAELQMQSVFTDVGKVCVQDAVHSFTLSFTQNLVTSSAWLNTHGHAHFALATPAGGITIVTLPPHDEQGSLSVMELKQSSVMQRLAGWVPSAIRGDQSPCDLAVSLAVWPMEDDTFIFALCQDHKLRVWSYKEQQCVLVADMLDYVPAGRAELKNSAGVSHRLRVCVSGSAGVCVCVYIAALHHSQFSVLQLVSSNNTRYSLEHISTIYSTQETLVDFVLTSTDIWGLWVDDDNQTMVKYINFEHNAAGMWNQVFVQPAPEEEVHIGSEQDPRETYLDVLFSPLRFTAVAIVKALQIYKRGTERFLDLTWETLKKEVSLAVENELQSSVTEFEFSQEDYRMLQVEFWSKFYACCLQYQEALSTPLALHVDQATAMVCLLKKGFVSFLLPCFAVDHLYLCSDEYLFSEEETPVADEPELSGDVQQLVQCLRLVSECLQGEMVCVMDRAVEMLMSPEKAAEQVLENLLANDNDNLISDITNKLQDVRNPLAAMSALLRELDLEAELDAPDTAPSRQSLSVRLSLSQLYSSSIAVSVVCQAVCHMTMTRALICRDLLILQHLYLHLGDSVLLAGSAQCLQLQQDLIPRCSHLLCCYHLLKQLSQTLASPVPLDTLDANLQHLSVLKLSDSTAVMANRSVLSPQTVVELFYQNVAHKSIVPQLFGQREAPESHITSLHWNQLISSVVHLLTQLLWPSNPNFLFPECMMGNCQYTQLQEYVRLIGPWCQANVGSCRFVLGQAYLACGEGQKALQCFQEAAPEVEKEEFLMRLTGSEEDEAGTTAPRLLYYNKVLRLLEDVGLPDLVIQLATLAVSEAVNDQRSQAALWTRIFKHHLDLGHNREAYEALTQNPDPSRQLDCLRQLVVVLCERAQLQDLIQFPYINLHEEVVAIIESRARAVDLMTHNYYELLYAFHINRHNYRKAGTVMFEYGMRLGREVRTLRGLQKQVNCYLSALNCLRLIRPEYAWIIQPSSGPACERPGTSPKRSHDGDLAPPPVSRQIEILELKDLEKEYVLARCRLTLAQQDPSSAAIAGSASAVEMVSLLVQAGLFDTALLLCETFKLPLTPVFEGLTFKCIKLQYGSEQSQNEAWNWLSANQLPNLITTKESSATDEAWRLLASYLEKHQSQNAQHHRCVINRLLSHGVPVPDWLLNAYKEVDAASLLRLYLNYDLLDPATELVMEYVDALLGKGHQYFGIEMPLSATAPLVWLPYTSIDQLLHNLRESQTPSNSQVYEKLRMKLAEYHRQVDRSGKHRLQVPA
ncbi:nuclear pore complex protein Nup160 isoform X1 [Neoarius graeffei]|uniref:nuclear pore complex protein Nup160 isoform X1 n=1 Tax=Neoarius graeffei TaxID=443677 RepID=UPI00298BD231|nr:nuclear pore complex protein Nup160 isoform X1 [Neoarius graeffei]